ncbi:MAG: endonuclease/exonuclease/phosphatase family protein [Candidatus Aminicenantaceae bacterium]
MTSRLRWISLVLAAVLAFSCFPVKQNYIQPEGPKFIGHLSGPPPPFTGILKVVSYNIKFSRKIAEAIQELESFPQLMDVDVLLLQEMDPMGVQAIAEKLRLNYVYYPAALHNKNEKGFGNAVLSPWPITKHMKVVLPHEHPVRKMNRNAVFATLMIADFELLAVSAHTELFILGSEQQMDQVGAVVDHIGQTSEYVVVGGDFNTESQYMVRETERRFRRAGFTLATKGIGPTARGGPLGIFEFAMDYIFIKGFRVEASGKVEEARASDHLPVWTTLRLEKMP